MVFWAPHSTSELARKMRLPLSRLRRRDPLQWQAKLVLEDEVMLQACLIIRREGDDKRALGAQLHVDDGRLQKFCRKRRPPCLALAAERDKSFLSRLGFCASSEHSSGCMSCTGTGRVAIKDLDGSAARRQAPGNSETNDAGANDGDSWFSNMPETVGQEAAPFAGMTQTGSMGLISAASPYEEGGTPSRSTS